VVITTGTPRTGIKHTVAKVTGYTFKAITGTEFGRYLINATTATGETLTDTRVRPATAAEAAEFEAPAAEVASEIVPAEQTALIAHSDNCITCRVGAETGRYCDEGMRLWAAAHRARHDFNRAPIITENRYGHRKAFWNAHTALSEIGINGGEIVKAPAGMIEAARREQAADLAKRKAERAARLASGAPRHIPAAIRRRRR